MLVAHWLSDTLGQDMKHWDAPTAKSPVRARVRIPGSKSQTNRALILAALAQGESSLIAPLIARDTILMCDALNKLGAHVDTDDPNCWRVSPLGQIAPTDSVTIDAGLAGTVMRFILPVAALAQGSITITGDERAKQRPIRPLIESLRALGVDISAPNDSLPIIINATGTVAGGSARIDASASSQFVSALLLAAPRFDYGIELFDVGPSLPSQPHIEMTKQMLRQTGVKVDETKNDVGQTCWHVHPGPVAAQAWRIEPDLSNAGPFIAAAMVTGGEVEIIDWPARTTQAGDHLRYLIDAWGGTHELITKSTGDETFGADNEKVSGVTSLIARGPERINGITVDLHDYGELTPTVAAVCAFATDDSTLNGIGHLRGHESDRLSALAENLRNLGVEVIEGPDFLTISPLNPAVAHKGTWRSFEDHRLATAGAIAGLRVNGVQIDDIDATSKTLPNFPQLWQEMLESNRH